MRELALQELLLNKEKFEYEKGIEVEEGDGSMPSSWREQQPEHSMSPAAGDDYQNSSSSDNAPLFFSNLCFLKNFPAAPSMAREGFWRGGRFQYKRNRGGEGVLAGEGHVLTAQKDDDANLQKIPLSGGFTTIEATTQYCQNIHWRLIGESSSKRISERKNPEDLKDTSKEGPSGLYPSASEQDVTQFLGKEGETRKPDWWAQEQKENVVAFAKVQEDIQKLRVEIKAYWEGKEDKGPIDKWVGKAECSLTGSGGAGERNRSEELSHSQGNTHGPIVHSGLFSDGAHPMGLGVLCDRMGQVSNVGTET